MFFFHQHFYVAINWKHNSFYSVKTLVSPSFCSCFVHKLSNKKMTTIIDRLPNDLMKMKEYLLWSVSFFELKEDKDNEAGSRLLHCTVSRLKKQRWQKTISLVPDFSVYEVCADWLIRSPSFTKQGGAN